jgi:hypothetical protein
VAKVINSDVESQVINSYYPIWKIILIGLLSGILFWLLTVVINQYIISPYFCRSSIEVYTCLNSVSVSGNVAMILIAVLGIAIMTWLMIPQSLVICIVAAAALWGLSQWTDGLITVEIIIWNIVVYILAYVLFSWLTRFKSIVPALFFILLAITAIRVAANL